MDSKLLDRLRPQIEAIAHPAGYEVEWGGEYEDSGTNCLMPVAMAALTTELGMIPLVFSVFDLKQLLEAIAKMPEVRRMDLLAHCRGSRVLIDAVREISRQQPGQQKNIPRRVSSCFSRRISTLILWGSEGNNLSGRPEPALGVVEAAFLAIHPWETRPGGWVKKA